MGEEPIQRPPYVQTLNSLFLSPKYVTVDLPYLRVIIPEQFLMHNDLIAL